MSIYSFSGQQDAYAAYRPIWSPAFAQYTMNTAALGKNDPVVAFLGAGTGADARAFAGIASKVILVEPNRDLLDKARCLIAPMFNGQAEFLVGNAMETGIQGKVDLIVAAQALHTFRDEHAGAHKSASLTVNAEELARRHWQDLLPEDQKSRVSVWYYNPAQNSESTIVLDDVLKRTCPKYKASKSPLLDAPYFDPDQFQPYIQKELMTFSDQAIPVDTVSLKEGDIASWLDSYSFKPDFASDREVTINALTSQWFNRFAVGGVLDVHYEGSVTQGPLRQTPFDLTLL